MQTEDGSVGPPLVVALLTSAPSLRLLATSRAPLRVRSERLYMLGPLDLQAHAETSYPSFIPAFSFTEGITHVNLPISATAQVHRERFRGR